MMGDRSLRADLSGRAVSMKNWRFIALHAVAAATFIFLLQRYALSASLESACCGR